MSYVLIKLIKAVNGLINCKLKRTTFRSNVKIKSKIRFIDMS